MYNMKNKLKGVSIMKKEFEKMEKVLRKEKTYSLQKDNFNIEVFKDSEECNGELVVWYNVLIKFKNYIYSSLEAVSTLDEVCKSIENLSETSKEFEFFKKKQSLALDIQKGKYKTKNNNSLELEDTFVSIYKGEEGKYNFNGLLNYLEVNLNKDEIFDYCKGKKITTSITSIRNAVKNGVVYHKELQLIENQLNKKICGYCNCTTINAINIHYVDNCGCVGKEHICPDCLELHENKLISLLSKLPKDLSNKDRVQALSYIYSELTKCS